ncbi:MAG TPA: OsmC family protein [Bacteroidia bacterium]|nr:OsmC family protein [Bacteroidia bacterium]
MSKISEIEYNGNLRTTSIHLRSGKQVITDAPLDNNGRGEAFSPTDLMSTSLGCCMMTIMGIVAGRHAISIEGMKAEITKIMGTEPRRVIEIVVDFQIPGKDLPAKDKDLLQHAALTCPVAHSLHPDLKQTVNFTWV